MRFEQGRHRIRGEPGPVEQPPDRMAATVEAEAFNRNRWPVLGAQQHGLDLDRVTQRPQEPPGALPRRLPHRRDRHAALDVPQRLTAAGRAATQGGRDHGRRQRSGGGGDPVGLGRDLPAELTDLASRGGGDRNPVRLHVSTCGKPERLCGHQRWSGKSRHGRQKRNGNGKNFLALAL